MKHLILSISIFCIFISGACSAQQPTAQIHLGNGRVVLLLDSADAAKAIVYDKKDGFFEKVTVSEMSIQMKKPLATGQDRGALLQEYIGFLKRDVLSFDESELKFMTSVLEKMYGTVGEVGPGILPDTLKIIKTRGRHYGEGVWYTRENCIIIPANELSSRKTNPFTATMYHELFHVYSRLHPDKSAQLYKLIGFEALGFDNLQAPAGLAERVLFNPDGVDYAQVIQLTQEDKTTIAAVPVIFANNVGYKPGNDEFFGYVEFNLYPVEKQANGKWMVKVKEDGFTSPLSMDSQPDFFRQIKDNTGYIIHPDEVLADNFAFIMQERNGSKVSLKFSAEGKQLLKDIETILKAK